MLMGAVALAFLFGGSFDVMFLPLLHLAHLQSHHGLALLAQMLQGARFGDAFGLFAGFRFGVGLVVLLSVALRGIVLCLLGTMLQPTLGLPITFAFAK